MEAAVFYIPERQMTKMYINYVIREEKFRKYQTARAEIHVIGIMESDIKRNFL